MSSSYRYYVETRCAMVAVERSMRVCGNGDCDIRKRRCYITTKFCAACGAPSDISTYETPGEAVSAENVKISESLCNWQIKPGVRVWTPNVRREPPRKFDFDADDENGALPLDEAGLPTEEMAWLCSAFDDEIDRLAEAYGGDSVKVRWGLVWMWS